MGRIAGTWARDELVGEQCLPLLIVLGEELCHRCATNAVHAESGNIPLSEIRGDLNDLYRPGRMEPLHVRHQHLVADRLHEPAIGELPLRDVGAVTKGVDDLRDSWLLAAFRLNLGKTIQDNCPEALVEVVRGDREHSVERHRRIVIDRIASDKFNQHRSNIARSQYRAVRGPGNDLECIRIVAVD